MQFAKYCIGTGNELERDRAIKPDQRPVGLIVPSTLVYPTKFYSRIIKEIPWFDGKQLIDPSIASDIKLEELLVLKNYLTILKIQWLMAISDRYSFDGILEAQNSKTHEKLIILLIFKVLKITN